MHIRKRDYGVVKTFCYVPSVLGFSEQVKDFRSGNQKLSVKCNVIYDPSKWCNNNYTYDSPTIYLINASKMMQQIKHFITLSTVN